MNPQEDNDKKRKVSQADTEEFSTLEYARQGVASKRMHMLNGAKGLDKAKEISNEGSVTDSDSTESQPRRNSQKKRRSSFFIAWDSALEIPPLLKRLQKFRLRISQDEFSQLEYQLYCTGCVKRKENCVYTYAATTVDLPNSVYILLQRYLPFYALLILCMWRYQNLTETIPSDLLSQVIVENFSTMDEEDEDGVIKGTQIKLNERHTIQNCMWTVKQRKAVKNTRDHYFNNFVREEPMISDLPLSPSSKGVIRDFIVGMWKAEIDPKTVFHICVEILRLQEFFPPPRNMRLRRRASVQRKSITEATIQDRSIIAAIIIQDFYRQRLERRRNAVKLIEIAWEPYRLQGVQIRRDTQEYLDEVAAQEEASEKFNWDNFSKEIKEDYLSIKQPLEEPREITQGDRYWLKVIALLTIPVGIATAVFFLTNLRYMDIEALIFIIYVIGVPLLITYMGDTVWLYFQTILNLTLLAFLIVITASTHTKVIQFFRLYILTFIVAITGAKWKVGAFLYLLLRNIYSIIEGADFIHFVVGNTFDIYGIITIGTASRRGSPIGMLHKLSVNLIVGVFVLAGIAFNVFMGCFTIQEAELPL